MWHILLACYERIGWSMDKVRFKIPLSKVVDDFQFEKLYESTNFEDIEIESADVNRPGLLMIGFTDYFDSNRIQILGKVELTYLDQFGYEQRYKLLEEIFKTSVPAVIITRGMQVGPEMFELAEEYDKTVLRCEESTSELMSALISYLNVQIAPRITRHGVLVEVYGEGILIMGESGVGKSEAAIELLKRGHRLVADDAVEIKRVSNKTLVGSAPDIIRHFVELRGIGVIDVKEIFGMGAVKDTESIDLIIHLEPWVEGKQYDRLGMVDEYTNVMGINVSSMTVPVKTGRNIAVIIEVAAMNNRQKRMGYNAAVELNNRLLKRMEEETQY